MKHTEGRRKYIQKSDFKICRKMKLEDQGVGGKEIL
jgi:hypothetical protein